MTELVELDAIKGCMVGLPGRSGLSVEQRKRLTIAVELVANPSIIFMDVRTPTLLNEQIRDCLTFHQLKRHGHLLGPPEPAAQLIVWFFWVWQDFVTACSYASVNPNKPLEQQ